MEADRDARFRALATHCAPRLASYLRRRSFSLTPSDVEDLVEETLVIAWTRLDDVTVGAEMPWLIGVARNVLNNARRAETRRRHLLSRLRPPAHEPSADAALIAQDELRRAIADLSEIQREVLLLHYWDGFSTEEIATIVGIPVGTVAVRLSRALQNVRRHMQRTSSSDVKSGSTSTRES